MTKTILEFPVRRTISLTRVWFETGNPAQPLACKWLASEEVEAALPSATGTQTCLNCA